MNEVWQEIKGYENFYKVSNLGQVKSLARNIGVRLIKERILKPKLTPGGYCQVVLCKEGQKVYHYIHRLVAEAFVPNINNKPHVNHIDECKLNNWATNLEWCTPMENVHHGTGIIRKAKARGKLVYCVTLNQTFYSTHEAARKLNLHQSNISRCCRGKMLQTENLEFRYV